MSISQAIVAELSSMDVYAAAAFFTGSAVIIWALIVGLLHGWKCYKNRKSTKTLANSDWMEDDIQLYLDAKMRNFGRAIDVFQKFNEVAAAAAAQASAQKEQEYTSGYFSDTEYEEAYPVIGRSQPEKSRPSPRAVESTHQEVEAESEEKPRTRRKRRTKPPEEEEIPVDISEEDDIENP